MERVPNCLCTTLPFSLLCLLYKQYSQLSIEKLIMQMLQVLCYMVILKDLMSIEKQIIHTKLQFLILFPLSSPHLPGPQIFFLAWQTPTCSQKYISPRNLLYPKTVLYGSSLCSQHTLSTLLSLIVLFIHSHILFPNIY